MHEETCPIFSLGPLGQSVYGFRLGFCGALVAPCVGRIGNWGRLGGVALWRRRANVAACFSFVMIGGEGHDEGMPWETANPAFSFHRPFIAVLTSGAVIPVKELCPVGPYCDGAIPGVGWGLAESGDTRQHDDQHGCPVNDGGRFG